MRFWCNRLGEMKSNRNRSRHNWLLNSIRAMKFFLSDRWHCWTVNYQSLCLTGIRWRFYRLPFIASNITDDRVPRTQRHLIYGVPSLPVVARWAGGEGYTCITSRGILGSCQSIRTCYPFFKDPTPVFRYPVLPAWDTWVLGNQDTCSYHTENGREAQGVCCTNPVSPSAPSPANGDEYNKIDSPVVPNVQNFGQWPPPIPTHPPDHTAATHPPWIFGIQSDTTQGPAFTTQKPVTTTRRTTWATRPPSFGFPPQTTTRRPTVITTEPPIINDVSFDASCGAKNGFLVEFYSPNSQ